MKNKSLTIIAVVSIICFTIIVLTVINNEKNNKIIDSQQTTYEQIATTSSQEITTTTEKITNPTAATVYVIVPKGEEVVPKYEYVYIGKTYRITYNTPGHAGLNIRSLPTYYSDKIATLKEGTKVTLIEDSNNGKNGYVHVSFSSVCGIDEGWVLSAYLM